MTQQDDPTDDLFPKDASPKGQLIEALRKLLEEVEMNSKLEVSRRLSREQQQNFSNVLLVRIDIFQKQAREGQALVVTYHDGGQMVTVNGFEFPTCLSAAPTKEATTPNALYTFKN